MKKVLFVVAIIALILFSGCKTMDPVAKERIVVPDLSVFRYDVFEIFPLIDEPATDADLMYNNLIIELDGALTHAFSDMLLEYNRTLAELYAK